MSFAETRTTVRVANALHPYCRAGFCILPNLFADKPY